ncbi:D-alanyl-D-alanine carboxypeptidase family protein (plasmid) [Streptomyces sp. BI20]|uniref:D-alanyl-D-alanine carboxypeptidase family protein n=1 Tax=Streptomyces sp. BI20 TaxID=3403460 RepID=UPI003C729AA2
MSLRFSPSRRTAVVAGTTGVLMTVFPLASTAGAAAPVAPTVTAKGAFLLDNASGAAKFSKAADTRRPMASTTKIMTAYVVLTTPKVDLNKQLTIQQAYPDYVNRVGASSAYLYVGDKVSVSGLLNGLLAPSGCDAAYALADAFGKGSTRDARTKDFIAQMNSKAKALGLTNTKFDSFDGNSPNASAGNYSTPRDLAKLASNALKNTTFRDIVKNPSVKATATASNGKTRYYTWYNSNQLLGGYQGTIGVKTGTNTPAGPCIVFAATRNGKTIVGTVLASTSVPNRYDDAKKIMDYGFGVAPVPKATRRGTSPAPSTGTELRALPANANRD